MNIIESLLTGWEKRTKSSSGEYCQVECNLLPGNKAFVSRDGGLISVFEITGALSHATEESNEKNVKLLESRLRASFRKEGFFVSIIYEKDKSRAQVEAKQFYDGVRSAAQRIGMNCDLLLKDSEAFLAERIIPEKTLIVFQTTPAIFSKQQRERANIERSKKAKLGVRPSQSAQCPDVLLNGLIKQHKGFVNNAVTSMNSIMHVNALNCYDSLGSAKTMVYRVSGSKWKPRLVGDTIDVRLNQEAIASKDLSSFMAPSISRQVFNYPLTEHESDRTLVNVGKFIAAPLYILHSPQDPIRFNHLLASLPDELPLRVCYDIQTGTNATKAILRKRKTDAGFARIFDEQAQYIFDACKSLITSAEKGATLVIQTIVFCTWGKTKTEALENRETLVRAIESWGSATPEIEEGDSIGGFLSTIPMFNDRSVGNKLPFDLKRSFKMMPFERPGSPFKNGSMLMRTIFSTPWAMEFGSSLQAFWSYLIVALPGAGKSALACRIMFSLLLSPENRTMPFIRGIDIGNTFGYWADSVRALLNEDVRHMVQRYKMVNDRSQQYNVFDTPLGLRKPIGMHTTFLNSFLSMLLTPAGDKPNADIVGALPSIIEELYRYRTTIQPRPYSQGQTEIDDTLRDIGFLPDDATTWWGVVDALFDSGKYSIANLAQRFAAPTLNDIVLVLQEVPSLNDQYAKVLVDGNNTFIEYITRRLNESMKAFKNLAGRTNMDVSNARIILIDLMDVAPDPKGDIVAAKQSSVYYMLANQILTRDLFINEEIINTIEDPDYRDYHLKAFEEMRGAIKFSPKDEFHRTKGIQQPRASFVREQREGRKFNFFPLAISQDLDTFDDEMIKFSSNTLLMNVPTEPDEQKDYNRRLGIPMDTLEEATRYVLGKPDHNGSSMLVKSKFGKANMYQVLYNTQPPQELWMNVTTTEDVQLKESVAKKVGLDKALSLLGKNFGPEQGFSAKAYIKSVRSHRASNNMELSDEIVFEQIFNEIMYN